MTAQQLLDLGSYVVVFLIGAGVGLGELVSRYRDEPTRAILTSPAAMYVAINGAASVFALFALNVFGVKPGEDDAQSTLLIVLAAGFGAMAVLRSALFKVRVGDDDIGVGPVAFLEIILGATDRGVDRQRAEDRAPKVVRIMDGLAFADVAAALPSFAMGLLQNLPAERQAGIAEQVKKLRDSSDLDERAKVLNLGLLLMNEVGEDVLEKASQGLRAQFGWPDLPAEPTRGGVFADLRKRQRPPTIEESIEDPANTSSPGHPDAATAEPDPGEMPGEPSPTPGGPTRASGAADSSGSSSTTAAETSSRAAATDAPDSERSTRRTRGSSGTPAEESGSSSSDAATSADRSSGDTTSGSNKTGTDAPG